MTFPIFYFNDRFPTCYTTVDDFTLLFDAYNSDEDSTLQKSKTLCFGKLSPTFTLTDSFTPDLDAELFSLLLNEAKAQAFAELKQQQNPIAEGRSRRLWIQSLKNRQAVPDPYSRYKDHYPNYGRK